MASRASPTFVFSLTSLINNLSSIFSLSFFFDDDESNFIDFSVHSNFHSHFPPVLFSLVVASTVQNRIFICVLSEYIEKSTVGTIGLNKGEQWQNIVLKFISGFFTLFFRLSKAHCCAMKSATTCDSFFHVCLSVEN